MIIDKCDLVDQIRECAQKKMDGKYHDALSVGTLGGEAQRQGVFTFEVSHPAIGRVL